MEIIHSLMTQSTIVVCQTTLVVQLYCLAEVTRSQLESTDLVFQRPSVDKRSNTVWLQHDSLVAVQNRLRISAVLTEVCSPTHICLQLSANL